jgi:holo-[acyl-carrier protein] synthase
MRLGIDIMSADELDGLVHRAWFHRFAFSPVEVATAADLAPDRRREFLAGRFAAKEAVLKVLGTGLFLGVAPRDISLPRDRSGAPDVLLSGPAAHIARLVGVEHITVSITHKRDLVAAVAMGW